MSRCYLVSGSSAGQNCGIKITAMKPQKALRISLSAVLLLAILLSPVRSNEAAVSNGKRTFSFHLQADGENSSDHGIKIDLTLPVNNKKEKNTDHNTDLFRNKRHADEDRHEHHHHHFDKSKSRRRIINVLTIFFLKIIIALSYFSILLCSYMNICH